MSSVTLYRLFKHLYFPHLLMRVLLGIALKALVSSGFLLHLLFFLYSECLFSYKLIKLVLFKRLLMTNPMLSVT